MANSDRNRMRDFRDLWAKVSSELQNLHGLISEPATLLYFDESLRANELGEALHTLCDHLLRPEVTPANDATIRQIEALHSLMEIKDDCVDRLSHKAG